MDEKEIIEYPVILIEEENGCLAIIPDIDGGVQGIEKEDTLQTAAEYIGEEIIDSGKIPEPDFEFKKLDKIPDRGKVFYVEVDVTKYKRIYERRIIRQASNYLMEKNKEIYRRLSER